MVWSIARNLQLEKLSPQARRVIVFLALTLSVVGGMAAAFGLRFDFSLPPAELNHLWTGLAIAVPIKLLVFHLNRLHRGWWTSFALMDLGHLVSVNLLASMVTTMGVFAMVGKSFPRSVYILDLVLTLAAISAARMLLRLYREHPNRRGTNTHKRQKPVLIYGAGWAGAGLMREIWANPDLGYRVVGFLDDNPDKVGESVSGSRVLGRGEETASVVDRLKRRNIEVQEVLIAMPSAAGNQMGQAISHCRAAGLICKTLPGIGELLSSTRLMAQIRDISVEDLLGREQVDLDEMAIHDGLAKRSVMVTGAAGSIGSELCRQIAAFEPRALVLVDRAESDIFRIDIELRSKFPGLKIVAEIADIRDFVHIEQLIRTHRVECVYHAAAYKHVPLMEMQPLQAAANNILGTWTLAKAAVANGVKSFVTISSDKAVNPTNVMGATKRVSELIVASLHKPGSETGAKFVSVRFGNVLASNGSVVPTFQSQIAAGGPITVTHPEVRRYFMTVREAVQLVLQAATMGEGSEVFVLDMGKPIRIVDLARNMIRLAGLIPDEDIKIRYVGLRPGEKLFEELITKGEDILSTHHEKIKIFQGPSLSLEAMEQWIHKLKILITERDDVGVIAHLSSILPEYQVSAQWKGAVEKLKVSAENGSLTTHLRKPLDFAWQTRQASNAQ
jgi:FlaA1/EpsC-like NDP-sugar epimerase